MAIRPKRASDVVKRRVPRFVTSQRLTPPATRDRTRTTSAGAGRQVLVGRHRSVGRILVPYVAARSFTRGNSSGRTWRETAVHSPEQAVVSLTRATVEDG